MAGGGLRSGDEAKHAAEATHNRLTCIVLLAG